MEDKKRKDISRRTVVKSLGASIAAYNSIGIVSSREKQDMVTIPVVKSGDEVVKSKKVPRKWREFEKSAKKNFARIQKKFGQKDGVVSIAKGRDKKSVAGKKVSNIKVYVNPNKDFPDIPSSINGVNVATVEEIPNTEPNTANTGDYDPIPGGVQLENGQTGGIGTTSQKVTVNGDPHLLTCAHLFGACDGGVDGNAIQGNDNLGSASGGINDADMDITTIPDYDVNDYADYIMDGDAPVVNGHLTEIAISDLKSNGDTVYKMGRTTGLTNGVIKDDQYMFAACGGTEYPYVRSSMTTEDGDSGAPHYYKYTLDGKYYAGIIGTHYGGESLACPAWKVNEKYGVNYDMTS